MSSVLRTALLFALITGLLTSLVHAQPEPTAADVKTLQDKFQVEREQALKARFPAESLVRADDLAKRAEVALKADNYKTATRRLRDARWQLPYLPTGLPEHVVRVFGEARIRHADRVNALVYSPDNTRLASASRDGTVKVWDLGNGREVVTYRGHVDQLDDPIKGGTNVLAVTDVAFHPREKLIASSSGNQVHLWDPETGKFIKTLVNLGKTDKPIKTIAFSPDGKFLAVGADDFILRVVESDTGKVTYTSPSRNARIEKLAYSPNGNMIVVGDSNSHVAVYAPAQPNQLAMTVQGIELGEVMGVAFTADSGAVFACGRDGKARLWSGPKPDGTSAGIMATRLREFSGHQGAVTALTVVPNGNFLITGGEDNSVRVWEVTSGKQIRRHQGHASRVTALAARGDGKQIASASDDGTIRLWDLTTTDDHRALTDATDSLWSVAYSPDGKRIAAAGADRTIRVYNAETGKIEATLKGAKSAITSLAFLPDSNRLASAGGDRVVVVWDVGKEKAIKELPGHESAILSVAVTDDGKMILSGSADKTLRAFLPDGDKATWIWSGRSAVCAVAARKGNKTVAAGLADGTLVVLDVSGSVPHVVFTQSAHVAGVACVAYSPDGTHLASVGGDGAVRVWTVLDTGTLTKLPQFGGEVKPGVSANFIPLTGVAFSPDGRYVAAVGADAVVWVWDVQTKSEVRGLQGHTDWITSVAFSPDGRFIASVGVEKDRAVRIFELSPLETSASGGHALAVNAVAVSPNGKIVATAGTDQTIKLWDIATGKEIGTLIENNDVPFAIAFLNNDSLVMGAGLRSRDTGRLHFWGTNPGRLTDTIPTGEVFNVVAKPDGSKIGVWASRPGVGDVKNTTYEVHDAKGNQFSTLSDKGREVRAVSFTPDLAWVVAGDKKGVIRIWELEKKDPPLRGDWPLFTNGVGDLGITPDKKYLVAVDDQGLVKVADVDKRESLGSVIAHKAGVRTLLVSPTGTTFVTVSNDREVKTWSLAPTDLKELKPTRTWTMPVGVNGVAYTPDGKRIVTANADGTAYVLELP